MSRAWPWPADTALDRARRLALGYRAALAEADPQRCAQLDTHAVNFGEAWVNHTPSTLAPDAMLSAVELAEALGVTPERIRKAASRGTIDRFPTSAGPRYRAGDVLDWLAIQRRARHRQPYVDRQRHDIDGDQT
ncbi:hypothetical protein NLX83_21480 [Allokutzneria sp. A3M-2-11 16]|uniref:hypothetical protein n=1 Tax=Allokutzneria sp. A3M-2-11 16 TaxID=2962043 RepID=UPI0020B6C02E|nr:hypothetical protein [Allokutzneria sp. A3M-2-11 16]MCP3801841.1 hypothetical protein [Allokutzneria sp. A3M-2-11 16]